MCTLVPMGSWLMKEPYMYMYLKEYNEEIVEFAVQVADNCDSLGRERRYVVDVGHFLK